MTDRYRSYRTAMKGIESHRITSQLALECWRNLEKVPGHTGVRGDEKADQLARKETIMDLVGPEHTVNGFLQYVKRKLSDWVYDDHHRRWCAEQVIS